MVSIIFPIGSDKKKITKNEPLKKVHPSTKRLQQKVLEYFCKRNKVGILQWPPKYLFFNSNKILSNKKKKLNRPFISFVLSFR